ncbi:unnamed protein product [Caenorhabditis angaria]|uniref:Uncharacterized protein n=1 Tax=Caenorhabditis angaria TaxID=860376 RepID=A0A9P1J031_9PELO|nr:unnamed protein product [Caenorhabditis angaria]
MADASSMWMLFSVLLVIPDPWAPRELIFDDISSDEEDDVEDDQEEESEVEINSEDENGIIWESESEVDIDDRILGAFWNDILEENAQFDIFPRAEDNNNLLNFLAPEQELRVLRFDEIFNFPPIFGDLELNDHINDAEPADEPEVQPGIRRNVSLDNFLADFMTRRRIRELIAAENIDDVFNIEQEIDRVYDGISEDEDDEI